MEKEYGALEANVEKEVDHFIRLLCEKEEIKQFKNAQKQVHTNEALERLIEDIRVKQKELVQFEYYEKPEASRQTKKELDLLQKELDENISLYYYQSSLREADELVQHLFGRIQTAVDSNKDK